MVNLIANENLKIYHRPRTWILLGLMLAAVVAVAVIEANHQPPAAGWQAAVAQQIAALKQALGGHLPRATAVALRQELRTDQYALRHHINPNAETAFKFAATAFHLDTLAMAFILVVAGDIVASEFSAGTIKMLLTQTATRTRIIVSKFVALVGFGLVATAALLLFSVVVGLIVFGPGASMPVLYQTPAGHVAQMAASSYVLTNYGYFLVQMIITALIAFMISTIFRSGALAITVSILAYLVGSTLVQALSSYHWIRFVLFANTNLSQYVFGGPTIPGLTLTFSITMLAAYFVVMAGLSWWVFVRRDVSGS